MCLMQRHPAPAPDMGRKVPKPWNKMGLTSPLIIAQATRRSEAEQTAAQLPLLSQLARPRAPGWCQAEGERKVVGCEKAASPPLFQQGL